MHDSPHPPGESWPHVCVFKEKTSSTYPFPPPSSPSLSFPEMAISLAFDFLFCNCTLSSVLQGSNTRPFVFRGLSFSCASNHVHISFSYLSLDALIHTFARNTIHPFAGSRWVLVVRKRRGIVTLGTAPGGKKKTPSFVVLLKRISD